MGNLCHTGEGGGYIDNVNSIVNYNTSVSSCGLQNPMIFCSKNNLHNDPPLVTSTFLH